MGKSTTAAMFADQGARVWDADAAVHRLYAAGGAGVGPIAAIVPDAILGDAVDRVSLREAIVRDPDLLPKIEAVIHPLVQADRNAFAAAHPGEILVFDIPLLFETGAQDEFDAVVVVSAPPEVQRARVLARPGMTARDFEAILARQMPDADKRTRADYVIDTSQGLEEARSQVRAVLEDMGKKLHA